MDAVLMVIGGLVGLAAGAGLGLWIGGALRERASWIYWVMNVIVLVVGMAAAFLGLQYDAPWAFVASVAFMGGGFTGLKYGLGKSVGLWAVHDRAVGNDEDLPR